MARLMIELIQVLAETGASETLLREAIEEFRTGLTIGSGGTLAPGESGSPSSDVAGSLPE